MDTFFDFIATILSLGFVLYMIFVGVTRMSKLECDRYGGDYHWSTGCLMKYEEKLVPLSIYKQVISVQITKPVPTNSNINLNLQ